MNCNGCGMNVAQSDGVCPYCGTRLIAGGREISGLVRVSSGSVGEKVFNKNISGILEIQTEFASGSGFLISYDGYALTNTHVIVDKTYKPCKNIVALINGKQIKAKVIDLGDKKGGAGGGIDLAVIKLEIVPSGATPLKFDRYNGVRNGEQVFAIGNSQGDGTCITSGIVSDRARLLCGKTYIMTDCAINPGNSGGPLLNTDGKVIGVNVMVRLDERGNLADGMKYAIPSDDTVKFAAKYIKNA